jgi:hypothetical protein
MCLTLFCVLTVDVPFACEQMPGNKAHCCAKDCPAPSRPAKHKEKTYSAHLLPYSVTNFDTTKLSRDDWQTAVVCTQSAVPAQSPTLKEPPNQKSLHSEGQHLFDVIRAAAAPLPSVSLPLAALPLVAASSAPPLPPLPPPSAAQAASASSSSSSSAAAASHSTPISTLGAKRKASAKHKPKRKSRKRGKGKRARAAASASSNDEGSEQEQESL